MKTGLFFGSFNPVHIGHMAIAGYMLSHTDMDQVWFVVSPHNPHKKKESLLAYHHRLEMVHLAVGDDERFRVSDIESKLPLPSYTIDTLTYLSEKYPRNQFGIIIGADNLKSFRKWKNAGEIVKMYHRYVYPRSDYDETELINESNISYVNAPRMEISSSFIRESVAAGRDVRYFLPVAVFEYIDENNLYRKSILSE
jgi:nicotinate-nucleotide adenylyltransferase